MTGTSINMLWLLQNLHQIWGVQEPCSQNKFLQLMWVHKSDSAIIIGRALTELEAILNTENMLEIFLFIFFSEAKKRRLYYWKKSMQLEGQITFCSPLLCTSFALSRLILFEILHVKIHLDELDHDVACVVSLYNTGLRVVNTTNLAWQFFETHFSSWNNVKAHLVGEKYSSLCWQTHSQQRWLMIAVNMKY